MKLTESNNTRILANSTKSVDIHLTNLSEFINVILPDDSILVIEPDATITKFIDDTQVASTQL